MESDLESAITHNYCKLAFRIIKMAISDAKYGDRNCRQWLKCEGAAWADALGLAPEVLVDWINGLPAPVRKHRHQIEIVDGQLKLDYGILIPLISCEKDKEITNVQERERYTELDYRPKRQPAYA